MRGTGPIVSLVNFPAAAVPSEIHDSLGAENLDLGGTELPVGKFALIRKEHNSVIIGTPEGTFHQHCYVTEFKGRELRVRRLASIIESVDSSGAADRVRRLLADQEACQIHLMNQVAGERSVVEIPVILEPAPGTIR